LKEFDPVRIQLALQQLRSVSSTAPIFGAESHNFVLRPTLVEAEVANFERQHKISLPSDYRKFLTAVGNGGAGPYGGVFPLGHMDDGFDLKQWHENDGFVGVLSEPFLLTSDWNDLTGRPADDLLQSDEAEYWRQLDEFNERYWHGSLMHGSLMNGAVPICHEGCALRIWLVVTGERAGCIWHDGRADYMGLTPLQTSNGIPATFFLWYTEWLDNALRTANS